MVKDIDAVVKTKKNTVKKVIHKHQGLFATLERIKLYSARSGVLHGIKSIRVNGETARIVTHCGQEIIIRNSKNSRVARWLRNRWLTEPCTACKIPGWKLEKYSTTRFVKKR